MEIRSSSIHFQALSGDGPREASTEIHFPREVRSAIAGLSGYNVKFKDSDHPLGQLTIRLFTEVDGDLVKVRASYGLRDWSGDWDDRYEGTIFFVVLADLEAANAPRPRSDMSITGIEVTQAIQHFRSSQHLDPDNVRADNSIPLIARKDTGLRVYVDYDADAGLPPVNRISGVVEVNAGSATFTLDPFESIAPRDNSQIDRGTNSHTLNFVLPEAWSRGEVNISCKVFDAANSALPSRIVRRTLSFDAREPLRMHAVGIRYTGQDEDGNDQDLPAPTLEEIIPSLEYVELTYPVPEVYFTGYTEIEVDKTFPADADAEYGCGDGFGDLLGTLRDLRGDSTDVYYGFLPDDVDTGGVGGCGGGGVGAGPISRQRTMAQEIGHAFGRDHAPCDDADRCSNPLNQDPNYPQYAEFPSDSIGEFGYNPHTNSVFDPADSFDFMGYSKPQRKKWVSPYTYMALTGAFPSASGLAFSLHLQPPVAAGAAKREDNERLSIKRMMLDLELFIDRSLAVTLRHSFHYPVARSRPRGRTTDFTVTLLDGDGRTLHCQSLVCDCHHCGGENCYPQHFRQWIPFNPAAKKLLVHQDQTPIHEEIIPSPPRVKADARYVKEHDYFELRWNTEGGSPESDLWYMVHWQDEAGSWRGLAPRSQKKQANIPSHLFGKRKEMRVRVLASSGIATGVAEVRLELKKQRGQDVRIIVIRNPRDGHLSPVIRAAVVENDFRTIPDCDVRWYDNSQREIGRGRSLPLGGLRRGDNLVRAVLLDRGRGSGEEDWIVTKSERGTFALKEKTSARKPQAEADKSTHTGGRP